MKPGCLPPKLHRLRGFFEELAEPAMRRAFADALRTLQDAGATVEEADINLDGVRQAHRVIMASEAAAGHEARFREYAGEYRPQIRALVEEGLRYSAVDYVRASDVKNRLRDLTSKMTRLLDSDPGTAIVVPAAPGPAPDAATTGDPVFNSPWSLTGDPVVSIPIGLSPEGLPLALQLVGYSCSRADLFAVARWCEPALRDAAEKEKG
jgi:Asp-tRNA(Asn)/Glu-tRNA(Gln) amidotransferase A subunit family amidase